MNNENILTELKQLKQSIEEISVYDLNIYSSMELYYKIANKLNEVIKNYKLFTDVISDEVIQQNQDIQFLLNEGLMNEVVNKINNMIADGTMDTIINNNLFNDLNNKVENYKHELSSQIKEKANLADVAKISSGTPLFASNITEMTDTTKNYVNTTDGYLYVYDNAIFKKTTVQYQSTGLDKEIQTKINKSIQGRQSINLVDRTKCVSGFLGGSGAILENENYETTDFINVESGAYVGSFNSGQWFICKYDINKNIIGSREIYKNSKINFNIDNSIKYIRVSFMKSITNFQIQNGTVLTSFEKYGDVFMQKESFPEDVVRYISQKPNTIIKVAKDNGDYTSVSIAVENANDGDVIIVYPGVYNDESVFAYNKDISIIGIDKHKCIIQNERGIYGQEPILMSKGRLSNLTIKTLQASVAPTNAEPYCLHIDNIASIGNTLIIEDCNFISYHGQCIGIGLRENFKLIVRNCEMINMRTDNFNNQDYKRGCVTIHQQTATGDNQVAIFDNCRMRSKNNKCFNIQDVSGDNESNAEIRFYNNIIYSEVTGKNCINGITSAEDNKLTRRIAIGGDSFGNNIEKFNAV